ncbi:PREDICTED: uncharacterized protein C16orf95 homolog isoform X1 [Hipposideros armiger]|uniref:Uncharacterized protein C16orf95 homolog isoform X1 n=3 Tax=Hipposideros armiger TaxID=186990 RepID=A0A8B7QPL3_HIPAR|nr:PREDICTED: uncharacterized protein C16orf95 homolog isoform X1 [Hipposideros armiger]
MGMRPHPKETTMLSLPAGGLGAWMLCRQHPPSPVFSSIFWMCPAPSAIHGEPMCCECQAKFRGHLPVPRTQAALPYWVPQTLRPQKQIQKTIRVCIPKVIKTCLCRCHCFEGRLPMPKDQATMPYWVPQVLRSHKKVVERQQSSTGTQETSRDSRPWYNCWRICSNGNLVLKWQRLQALHHHRNGPLAPGRGQSPQALLLPLSLLPLLQAILKVITVIRQYFLV